MDSESEKNREVSYELTPEERTLYCFAVHKWNILLELKEFLFLFNKKLFSKLLILFAINASFCFGLALWATKDVLSGLFAAALASIIFALSLFIIFSLGIFIKALFFPFRLFQQTVRFASELNFIDVILQNPNVDKYTLSAKELFIKSSWSTCQNPDSTNIKRSVEFEKSLRWEDLVVTYSMGEKLTILVFRTTSLDGKTHYPIVGIPLRTIEDEQKKYLDQKSLNPFQMKLFKLFNGILWDLTLWILNLLAFWERTLKINCSSAVPS